MSTFILSSIWRILVLTVAAGLLIGPAAITPTASASPARKTTLISEYRSQIFLINEEILSLKENLAWLKIKIRQMQKSGKPVPKSMEDSVAFKRERICVLEQTRGELTAHLEKIRVAYPVDGRDCGQPLFPRKEMEEAGLELVKGPDGEVVVRTESPVRFASGSAKVAARYFSMLKKVSAFIKSHRPWVVVDGFTDRDPIKTENFPSNFELGAVRAANIVHKLVGFGADPSRFKLATTGEFRFPEARPLSENKNMERYVNITLIMDKG